jgi:competence protein ComEC
MRPCPRAPVVRLGLLLGGRGAWERWRANSVLAAALLAGCTESVVPPAGSSSVPPLMTAGSGGAAPAAPPAAVAVGGAGGAPASNGEGVGGMLELSGGADTPAAAGAAGSGGAPPAPAAAPESLSVYFVDSEGGQSTVFHLPNGQLLLVDSGNPGARDGERLLELIRDELGATKLDYVLTTHFDSDHWGGVPYLAARLEIGQYLDHGDTVFGGQSAPLAYLQLANAGARRVLSAGDVLRLGGVTLDVVSASGALIESPLSGAGQTNAFCAGAMAALANDPMDENVNSVGFVLRYGDFELLDLGDLLWFEEHQLACPTQRIGRVDLYLTTHHGLTRSGAPQLVRAIEPLAAIMNNGPRKGGGGSTWNTLALAPGAADVWQVHRAVTAPDTQNAPPDQIANLMEGQADAAEYLKIVIDSSGQFTISNPRTGFSKVYQSRP